MRKTWKEQVKMVLGCLLLCLTVTICIPGLRSEAAVKKPVCAKSQTVYIGWVDGCNMPVGYSGWIFIGNLSSKAKITDVKSSNKKIRCQSKGDCISLLSNGKSAIGAKSKITFKVKQNKKTYKLSCNVTFKKDAPFKSLKIGGKEIAKKEYLNLKKPYKKIPISIKMNSGRKLKKILWVKEQEEGEENPKFSYKNSWLSYGAGTICKKIKNNSKIALTSGDMIEIEYTYAKPKYIPNNKNWKGFEITEFKEICIR